MRLSQMCILLLDMHQNLQLPFRHFNKRVKMTSKFMISLEDPFSKGMQLKISEGLCGDTSRGDIVDGIYDLIGLVQ